MLISADECNGHSPSKLVGVPDSATGAKAASAMTGPGLATRSEAIDDGDLHEFAAVASQPAARVGRALV